MISIGVINIKHKFWSPLSVSFCVVIYTVILACHVYIDGITSNPISWLSSDVSRVKFLCNAISFPLFLNIAVKFLLKDELTYHQFVIKAIAWGWRQYWNYCLSLVFTSFYSFTYVIFRCLMFLKIKSNKSYHIFYHITKARFQK